MQKLRFTDKITYEVTTNEWTEFVEFSFQAPVVASETDVLNAVYKNSFYGPEHDIYVERNGTNAVKPHFYVHRTGYSDILFKVRPKESE